MWWPYFDSSLSPSIVVWCCDSRTSSVCPMGWLDASIPSNLESQEFISWSFRANCSLSDAIAVHSLFRDNTRCCKWRFREKFFVKNHTLEKKNSNREMTTFVTSSWSRRTPSLDWSRVWCPELLPVSLVPRLSRQSRLLSSCRITFKKNHIL